MEQEEQQRDKKQRTDYEKLSFRASIFALILSLATIVISMYSLSTTIGAAEKNLEYEITQARLPNVTVLNQYIPIRYARIENGTVDFLSIAKGLCPVQIPLYNVGEAIAQNVKLEWESKSIEDAYVQLKDLLGNKLRVTDYTYFKSDEVKWLDYDYLFEMRHNELESIIHYVSEKYIYEEVACDIYQFPFILSVANQPNEARSIELPAGLSVLMMEAANQGIVEPISLILNICYQNLAGDPYEKNYQITYAFEGPSAGDSDDEFICALSISTKETTR